MKPKQLLIIANYPHLIILSLTEEHEHYLSYKDQFKIIISISTYRPLKVRWRALLVFFFLLRGSKPLLNKNT